MKGRRTIGLPGQSLCTLLPLLLLCACTTTIKPVGSMPIADPSTKIVKEGAQQHQLETLPAAALLAEGERLLAEGNPQLAQIYLLKALEKEPSGARGYVDLGMAWQQAGDLPKARFAYEKALTTAADNAPALLALARLDRRQGNEQEAERRLSRVLTLEPDNVEALTELAMIYQHSAAPAAQTESLLRKVVALRPHAAASHNNLGYDLLVQERYPEAIDALQRALSLDPGNAVARNNLAAAYALSGQTEQALQLFTQGEGKAAAWNNLGFIYLSQKRYELAEQAFNRALELSPRFYARARQNLDHLQYLRQEAAP